MRQKLRLRNIIKIRKETGLKDIIAVQVRGGTNHRRDLLMPNGIVLCLYKDGAIVKSEFGWTPYIKNRSL